MAITHSNNNSFDMKLGDRLRRFDSYRNEKEATVFSGKSSLTKFVSTLKPDTTTLCLDVSDVRTGSTGFQALLRFLSSSRVQKLQVSSSDSRQVSSASTQKATNKILCALPSSIESLALCNVTIEGDRIAALLDIRSKLQDLSITNCQVEQLPVLSQALRASKLEKLHLVSLSDRILLPILQDLQYQETLNFLGVSYNTMAAAEAISNCIGTMRLEGLGLRNSYLRNLEPIVRNLSRSSTVRRLVIVDCCMDTISASLLSIALSNLTSFVMSDVDLSDDDEYLLETMLRLSPQLKRLQLERVKLRSKEYGVLHDFLQTSQSLQRVELDRAIWDRLQKTESRQQESFFSRIRPNKQHRTA